MIGKMKKYDNYVDWKEKKKIDKTIEIRQVERQRSWKKKKKKERMLAKSLV